MKKKTEIKTTELDSIFQIIGGSLSPAYKCIESVYIACFNKIIDPGMFETYCVLKQPEQKKQVLDNIRAEIEKNKTKLDKVILSNKKAISDFFDIEQSTSEENGIVFDEKRTGEFWRNLDGGAYGGGKDFLNNAIKSICNYSESSSYKTNVFLNPLNAKPLLFDKGAMSYICARPSAGKTTALLNIVMDALHQARKVVYFTAEETIEQLSVKLIKNEFFSLCNNSEYKSLINKVTQHGDTQEYFKGRIKYLFSMSNAGREEITKRVKGQSTDQDLIDYKILQAIDFINEKAQNESIQFISVSLLNGFDGLKKEVALQEPDTIVLFDYIQKLPIPQSAMNYNQAYSQLKNLVNELSSTVRDNGLIGIAGAQMGRDTDKGKTEQLLSMSYIRECGDIENDATLCIGIGKNKDTNARFYNVMKSRNGNYNESKIVSLNDNYDFAYMRTKGTLQENGLFELEYYNSKKRDDLDFDDDE